MSAISSERLAAVVESIPTGRWASYGDVAQACGGTDRHARTINQRLIRLQVSGAHRVLMADGSIGPTALGDPTDVRQRLEAEGIKFHDGRASSAAKLRSAALVAAIEHERLASRCGLAEIPPKW